MKSKICLVAVATCGLAFSAAAEWTPVTGSETLTEFLSTMTAERTLANGKKATAVYHADGTGELTAWGATISRTWEVQGKDRIAITARGETLIYALEKSDTTENLYRVTDVNSGEVTEFTLTNDRVGSISDVAPSTASGGAAAPTSDEIAAELSNPNTALASLNLRNQFRWFDGDLPNADGQFSYTALFQPVLPFPLENGSKVILRPGIPFIVDQPVPNDTGTGFKSKSGLGDIAFDLVYAFPAKGSFISAAGIFSSLPTASSSELGTEKFSLGPEAMVGFIAEKSVGICLVNHLWDVAGSGDSGTVNNTGIQLAYTYLPGGGYNIGTAPLINYDWNAEQWNIPLNLTVGKTVMWNNRPWKLALEVNYYVEKSDAIAAEWMVGVNISPVVKNVLADWL